MANKNPNIHTVVTEFIEYCEIERGLSPATALKYDYRLARFIEWMKEHHNRKNITLKDVTLDTIRKFRVYLNRKELKEATRYNYLVTIRSFLKFLIKHDYPGVEPEKVELGRHSPARSLKFLTPEQLDQLLNQPDIKSIRGVRDRAILELLFSTGLRVSELSGLNCEEIDFKRNEFTVIGKGQRRRVVFISDSASEWLSKYLDMRNDNFVPLFISYSGPTRDVSLIIEPDISTRRSKGSRSDETFSTDADVKNNVQNQRSDDGNIDLALEDPEGERYRLTVRSIQRLVKKYAKKAGVTVDVTPHVLRHSFATDMLTAGADLRTVQESLGHKNVSTTQIYTHVTNLQLKKAHKKYHGQWKQESGK